MVKFPWENQVASPCILYSVWYLLHVHLENSIYFGRLTQPFFTALHCGPTGGLRASAWVRWDPLRCPICRPYMVGLVFLKP